jgi:chemotaxis protein methyltransferase CheR
MAIPIEPEPKEPFDPQLEEIELRLLLEGIFQHYGYDFRDYSYASIRRRIWNRVRQEHLTNISALQEKVLHDMSCLHRLLFELSVTSTALFRDPSFYQVIRQQVIPELKTHPFVRIWHVGCSTGEEVYSLAILLSEAGIYDRCIIYATDINESVLYKAKSGIYPLQRMQEYADNYLAAGGERSLSEYYVNDSHNAIFSNYLRRKVVFSVHNLATDRMFNEFNLILCRNVLIYFNKPLQDRVHTMIYESLSRHGILGLGNMETIKFSPHETGYRQFAGSDKIYRRIR